MQLAKENTIKPFQSSETKRPWGSFLLFADNKKCTVKILYIKKGEMLSLQYHFKRDQQYIILSNGFTVDYSNTPVSDKIINEPDEDLRVHLFNKFLNENMVTVQANENDIFGFKRKVIHRAMYNGDREYGLILDIAYGFNDEDDITRVDDKYGRSDVK
jgi:hypothetical protein